MFSINNLRETITAKILKRRIKTVSLSKKVKLRIVLSNFFIKLAL